MLNMAQMHYQMCTIIYRKLSRNLHTNFLKV